MSDWKRKWQEAAEFTGKAGGHGTVKFVRKKDIHQGPVAVLKLLNKQKDYERRSRMYREVKCLETLDHPDIPKVIESNVDEYKNIDINLYFVQEYVPGPTLEEHIAIQGPMSLADAFCVVDTILEIITYCHSRDVYHRDIKPDNIIVDSVDPVHVRLVDFGQGFNTVDTSSLVTDSEQHLGNRFLMLPELQVAGSNKRDLRSDLTSCMGVFLFCLTAERPTVLLDDANQMPHQRPRAQSALSQMDRTSLNKLMRCFDTAFQVPIDARYQTAASIVQGLKLLRSAGPIATTQETTSELLARARNAYISDPEHSRFESIREVLNYYDTDVGCIVNNIYRDLGATFTLSQSNHDLRLRQLMLSNTYGIRQETSGHGFEFRYTVRVSGSEVVLEAVTNGQVRILLRKPILSYLMTDDDKELVKRYIVEGLIEAREKANPTF